MKNQRSVFYTWLISYIIILLLPVLTGGVLYVLVEQALTQEVTKSSNIIVNSLQQSTDSCINEVNKMFTQVGVNSKIESLLRLEKSPNNADFYLMREVRNDLRVYNSALTYIDECYLYLEGIDTVLTVSNTMSLKDTYAYIYGNPSQNIEEFKSSLLSGRGLRTQNITKQNNQNDDSTKKVEMIMFIQTLPVNTKNAQGAIIMMVEKSKLIYGKTRDQIREEGALFVLDKKNNLIFSKTNDDFNITSFINKDGVSKIKANGRNAYLVQTTSAISGWKHISLTTKESFLEKIYKIRNFALIGLLLYLIMGFIIIKFFLRYNYNPLDKLLSSISDKGSWDHKKTVNEFNFIKEIVSRTVEEKERISKITGKQKNILRANFLQRLLRGNTEPNIQVQDSFSSFEIKPISDDYIVLVVCIDDAFNFFTDEKDLSETERHSLMLFILDNVLTELLSANNYAFTSEYDEMLACIVNIKNENIKIAKTQIEEDIKQAQIFIKQSFHFDFTVSISNVHQTIEGISEACKEALTAMEYKIIMEDSSIIYYDGIKNAKKGGYYYPLEKERQLINYIRSGEADEAKELLEEILKANFGEGFMTIQLIKCLMFDISSTMIKTVQEVFGGNESEFLNQLSLVERLTNCDNISDMQGVISSLVTEVCSYVISKGETQVKNKVINMIKENYANNNLTVSSIADYLKLHPTYLSAVFKEQTGEGLLEYIMKIRIEKSKELLFDKNKTLEEISAEVGYASARTYTRVFKKIEGITPAKFRLLEGII